ncbi:hypothetical protein SLA2020_056350 [Shorea laevis]
MEESEKERKAKRPRRETTSPAALINDDVLHCILSRLSAFPFASAACVSKTWNRVCNRILSRPKLASAISLNPSPLAALREVVDKVLSQPIRPHFAIANIGPGMKLKQTLKFMVDRLGSTTPIVVSSVSGVIGRDAVTDEFKEVKWRGDLSDDDDEGVYAHSGIVLTVGYVPGIKVDAIPLCKPKKAPRLEMIDKFVMDIRNYTASVSGSTSPTGIIMFGVGDFDQKPVIEKLDYAMPMKTIIVGDERCPFLYKSGNNSRNIIGSLRCSIDAVALVFANDREKAHGIGDIQFHVALSDGVLAIGQSYKAASVRVNDSEGSTWLTARRERQKDVLDGQQLLDDVNAELENHVQIFEELDQSELYIGVTKRRNYSVGSEKARLKTSLVFHEVIRGDEEYLYVDDVGIRSGDTFQFYLADSRAAKTSCNNVSIAFGNLKLDWETKNCSGRNVDNAINKEEPFGGFIFSCCGRGKPFFDHRNVDSSPFLENFPDMPLAGTFCSGEIARGHSSSIRLGSQEKSSVHCCLHVYSTVYLVMSYTPALEEY